MRRLPFVLLALASPAAHTLAAQVPAVRPGSGTSTEHIRPHAQAYDVYVERAGEAPVAVLTLETLHADVDGVPAIVRRETLWLEGQQAQVDSFVLARESLAPIAAYAEGISRNHSLVFAAGRVRGWTRGEHRMDSVDAALPERVFLSASMDLVLAALPLRAGYAADLALFDPDEGMATARVSAGEAEDVRAGDARVRAWPVTVRGSTADGTYRMSEGARTLVQFVAADRSMRILRRGGAGTRRAAR